MNGMRPNSQDALDRWLAAERFDDFDQADAALLELFEASLPQLTPPAGFADRVVDLAIARAGLLPAAAKRDVFASWWLRLALALGILATGLAALWVTPAVRVVAGLWSLSDLVQVAVRAVSEASRSLATVLRVWDWVFAFGRALSEPLMAPRVLAGLTLSLLASGLAFRFLRDQISGERNWNYVDRM
jgi:hypothetical protein